MIPKVRTWIVRYYRDGALVALVPVRAVNKDFARWNASRLVRQMPRDKVTVTLAPKV